MQCGKRCRSMCVYSAVQEVKPEGRRVCGHHRGVIVGLPVGARSMLRPARQGLSLDLETGCPKVAIVNFSGILFSSL